MHHNDVAAGAVSLINKMIHHKTVSALSGGLILFWVKLVVDLLGSAVEK